MVWVAGISSPLGVKGKGANLPAAPGYRLCATTCDPGSSTCTQLLVNNVPLLMSVTCLLIHRAYNSVMVGRLMLRLSCAEMRTYT